MQQRLAVSRQSMAEEELLRTQSDLKRAMTELKVLQNRQQKNEAVDPPEPRRSGRTSLTLRKPSRTTLMYSDSSKGRKISKPLLREQGESHGTRRSVHPDAEKGAGRGQKKTKGICSDRLRSDLLAGREAPPKPATKPNRVWPRLRIRSKCMERFGTRSSARSRQVHWRHTKARHSGPRDGIDSRPRSTAPRKWRS